MIELKLLQLYPGSGIPILTTKITDYAYIPQTRLTFLWRFLTHINAYMHISCAWILAPVRDGDSLLMDQFRARGNAPHTMHILNKYRIHLKFITLADITNLHGTHIEKWVITEGEGRSSYLT